MHSIDWYTPLLFLNDFWQSLPVVNQIVLGALLLIGLVVGICSLFPQACYRHVKNVRTANKLLAKLSTFENPAAVINYLRKIDPFVFEKLLLSAFKKKGCKIKRNSHYTGDGGIDGRIFMKGKLFLVQAKRYKGHINAEHVREFERAIKNHGAKGGFFVHTGRTGEKAFPVNTRVKIISGDRLVSLLATPG